MNKLYKVGDLLLEERIFTGDDGKEKTYKFYHVKSGNIAIELTPREYKLGNQLLDEMKKIEIPQTTKI